MNRVLIDTNYLFDLAMEERPEREYALMLFDQIAYSELKAYVAATSLKDLYYIGTKYIDEPHTRAFIRALFSVMTVVSVDELTCRLAINSDEPDFEDGIIRTCAEQLKVDYIISRDEKAFEHSPIKRLSAKEYCAQFVDYETIDLSERSQ